MVDPTIIARSAPLVLAAGGLTLLVMLWAVRLPKVVIMLLGLSLVIGQLVRVTLPGQGGGLLVSDIAVLLVLAASGLLVVRRRIGTQGQMIGTTQLAWRGLLLIIPFIVWSLATLVMAVPTLAVGEAVVAAAYWLRLTCYVALFPALLYLASEPSLRRVIIGTLGIAGLALVGLAMVQLWFWPDLLTLSSSRIGWLIGTGWDPHSGRAMSSWLDPNFLGIFFAILTVVSGSSSVTSRHRVAWLVLASFSAWGVAVSQSRSTLVSVVVAAILLSPVLTFWLVRTPRRAKLLVRGAVVVSVIVLSLVMSVWFVRDRILGLITFDPTVALRLAALAPVWQLAIDHSVIGVGYNAYQFAARAAGLIGDFAIHSRAGADSSLLTVWVTTGVVGVLLWLQPLLVIFLLLLRRWLINTHWLSLAGCLILSMLLVHSNFVNSLLYGHLLIVLGMVIAVALTPLPERHGRLSTGIRPWGSTSSSFESSDKQ